MGDKREQYPLTCYIAAGSQAQRGKTNHVILMKMSNLHRTSNPKPVTEDDEEEEEESSDSENEEDKPELETAVVNHPSGSVNRIRVCLYYK